MSEANNSKANSTSDHSERTERTERTERSGKARQSGRHNKIYRCPPTPHPGILLQKEKSFVLDNIAVNRIREDYSRQTPKLGEVIPPYNAQLDRHPRAYFRLPSVERLLRSTEQDAGGSSILGHVMDRHWHAGPGARYLDLRNTQDAYGRSRDMLAGPGRVVSRTRVSCNVLDPDIHFGRKFVSPYLVAREKSSL